jgi:PleD family two-component response regulator
MSEVVSVADDALFSAKRDGRNMVRMQLIESD